ncbi:UDP-N-acetylmuramoyl-L-alanine--D-glutamate ligase [Heyndrickxia oleronia]|uniref:UDP-N-acetylmuramoyl-L-alanine--D-glutamate ligase n=1 Tax=Heyndrickxia oleronia TaxID=38875 RepID=UPI00243101DA|nr:UDP-N-acetylmuramoyl-L-alanine--D-glutamate ligase [Heyndrickxia oleronia]MCI1589715.1 UDP-N-acetylmuramoyl-L-alanine--D-glutamate ligase [Heyndrickxia oleronia]MCI1611538.1 UDP-N-acetylmuramoyl-L-alanine--D-glutamate ligase [Heyndrickxia oleronia]MCI1742980.1 UDP-N-acetylmuramoyl-L-alanine--D-glutamate ligase [Heyndrickxia oleronia]MCI1760060.1 UDP-N-acetylmuramoyl-L-alanine--D-glutamate ligase [Heyndrickxia oleronia]
MKTINNYQHKKILVLGLAKSGVSAASLLHKLGAFVTVNDYKPLNENPEAQGLLEQGIKVICGCHPIELLDEGFELIVKNPGIPYTNPLVAGAIERGIPVITEVELAYQISEAELIGITGTNGKTTTTTLIFEILQANEGTNPLIAGNIGTVASEVAETATKDNQMVVELSSFQLMGIRSFRPHIAIITNIYEAHLDYHGTKKEYAQAKANITRNQLEGDYLIVNADQEELLDLISFTKAKIIPFSAKKPLAEGCSIANGMITFLGEEIIPRSDIVLPGEHNLENIMAAIAATKLMGVQNKAIRKVLTTFKGVKHRTQFVEEIAGRKFYNDSKATNILAAQSALNAFSEPIILLAGGLDRGNEFDELIPSLKNVKVMITFGQTAEKLEKVAEIAGIETVHRVDNVEKAVPIAFELSKPGDVILLSPACASWDQYKTFEVRGDIFIDAVHKLK